MKRLLVIVGLLFLAQDSPAEMRSWTSVDGESAVAEFVRMVGNKVLFRTSEGKTIEMSKAVLSPDDIRYLAGLGNAASNAGSLGLSPRDYTFSYWLQGRRGKVDSKVGDVLVIETGYYGFTLDMAELGKPRFGLLDDGQDYATALHAESSRFEKLEDASFRFEVEKDGRRYRATQLVMPQNEKDFADTRKRLQHVWLWESGRIAQHLELHQVRLESADGESFPGSARLSINAFPDALTFAVAIDPDGKAESWKGAKVSLALEGSSKTWRAEHVIEEAGELEEEYLLALPCVMIDERVLPDVLTVTATQTSSGTAFPTIYDRSKSCFVTSFGQLQRDWKTGYTEIRDYDEFDIVIDNRSSKKGMVRYMMHGHPANSTGMVPILCEPDGTPTGIPVQLSKNWHKPPRVGSYFRPYALIPSAPGKQRYKMRFTYGYYGCVPGASHAQLSLVGYGGNGRWDQLAIGCWGETMCFDMDMSLTTTAITDVRTLFVRNGPNGKKWEFTSAGHGGDWLNVTDERGEKLLFNQLKTAYLTQGPCLTDVSYSGYYGSQKQVRLNANVKTLRTDDYHRTFQNLEYEFQSPLGEQDGWLFKLGNSIWPTQSVVYGNAGGELGRVEYADGVSKDLRASQRIELDGPGPWWVAFPEAGEIRGERGWGHGSRALIIREYDAEFRGRVNESPTIALPVKSVNEDGWMDVNLCLVPPAGVEDFRKGDRVKMRLEWITLPRHIDDYYGPNEAFREHLTQNPRSWKTTYREAMGNDLKVEASGARVKQNYPILIESTQEDDIRITVRGGVGFVPVRFENLPSRNYALYQVVAGKRQKLDQSVHGNDFWQTDYDPASDSYSMTFNLPLDGLEVSGWELKAE